MLQYRATAVQPFCSAILMADIAHISGLVATKQHPSRALRCGHDDDAQVGSWPEDGNDLLQV